MEHTNAFVVGLGSDFSPQMDPPTVRIKMPKKSSFFVDVLEDLGGATTVHSGPSVMYQRIPLPDFFIDYFQNV